MTDLDLNELAAELDALEAPVTRGELLALIRAYNENFRNLAEIANGLQADLSSLGEVVNSNADVLDFLNVENIGLLAVVDRTLDSVEGLAGVVQRFLDGTLD
jgi:hypothetical protein